MSASVHAVPGTGHPLKTALSIDATVSGASGIALLVLDGPLARWTDLPAPLLFWVGLFFVGCAALMAFTASRSPIPAPLAWLIALGNAGWVVASLVFVVLWPVTNTLAMVLVVGQALAVAVLTVMELRGLRMR